jgi:predicted  nucleic acid-binding Zn-ribbon protein
MVLGLHIHHHHHYDDVPTNPSDVQKMMDMLWAIRDDIAALAERMATMENHIMSTTSDLVTAVQALIDNSSKMDDSIDQLANAGSDQAALQKAVTDLQSLKTDQDSHLAKLVTVAPAVVAAPADSTPVSINQP